jgi:hypothetical protein
MRPATTLAVALLAGLAAGAAFFGGRRLGGKAIEPAAAPSIRQGLAAKLGLDRLLAPRASF